MAYNRNGRVVKPHESNKKHRHEQAKKFDEFNRKQRKKQDADKA